MDAVSASRSHPLPRGTTVSHYRIVAEIGRGGMGVVYAAEDLKLHRRVALKFLPDSISTDRDAVRRFEREAQAASALNHPNICTIYGIEEADGEPFIEMELLDGETIEQMCRRSPLEIGRAVDLAIQISDALDAAHNAGIVHRDIKPGNIFVTSRGQVKVLDFGLAKIRPSGWEAANAETVAELTMAGTVMGTTAYMSPEQVRGRELDGRSDLFSFGAVLYRMITAALPFRGASTTDLLDAILHDSPPPPVRLNPAVSAELEAIVFKALEKDRDVRYQHASDLGSDLKRLKHRTRSDGAASPAVLRRNVRGSRTRTAALAIAAAVLVIGGVVLGRFHRAVAFSEKDDIVLADFENRTGDPIFDDTLKEALATDLQQSPFLNILSQQRVRATLRLMGRKPDDRLTEETARDVCRRAGAKAMLTASIGPLGSHFVIGLNAMNCATGDSLEREERDATRKEDVLDALGQAARKLRERLGESLASVQKFDTPIEEATTSSFEALKAYSRGVRARWERTDAEAIPLLQHAIELDPNFAWAYLHLAVSYSNLGESDAAARYAAQAYALRDRVSERERCTISAEYHLFVTGQLDKEILVWAGCARTYPRYFIPPLGLGAAFSYRGEFERSLASTRDALRLEPTDGNCYANLMVALLALNRVEDAKAAYRMAIERKVDNVAVHFQRYEVAFVEGDRPEMQRQVAWSAGKPGVEGLFLIVDSATAAGLGRITTAREVSRRAVDSATLGDQKETAGEWQASTALWEAEFADQRDALKDAAVALRLSSTRDVKAPVALALARAGRTAEARSLADGLATAFPLNTVLHSYWLPSIRAAIALDRKEPARAIELLQSAAPYEISSPPPFVAPLCPVYLRGQAYLLMRQGDRAAGEFQKILDHPGIVLNSPLGPLARLGLARAYAMSDQAEKARRAYADFLARWKDADGRIPILDQARAEFARLK